MKTKLKNADKHACYNKSSRLRRRIRQLCSRISSSRIRLIWRTKMKNQASKMRDSNKLVDQTRPQSVLSMCVSNSQNLFKNKSRKLMFDYTKKRRPTWV
jgi:hypothetical protein